MNSLGLEQEMPIVCNDCTVACRGRSGLAHLPQLAPFADRPTELAQVAFELTGSRAAALCGSWWVTGFALANDPSGLASSRSRISQHLAGKP